MIRDLVMANRSYRRFRQEQAIDEGVLKELVDLARLSPSGANLQPLKYVLSSTPEKNDSIFPTLAWAGYLKEWPGPDEGERPSAYIVVLGDSEISKSFGCDQGIACQSILLGAVERGLGGCMIGSIDREALREVLKIPARYDILLVVALGVPEERVVIESLGNEGSIRYYRDQSGVHHVPKRSLEEIVIS